MTCELAGTSLQSPLLWCRFSHTEGRCSPYLITRLVSRDACYTNMDSPNTESIGHKECLSNWIKYKGLHIEMRKGWLFSQRFPKGPPSGHFHFLLGLFLSFFPSVLTEGLITSIIIYFKISCLKMKPPSKILGSYLHEGKFLFWKMQASSWSL